MARRRAPLTMANVKPVRIAGGMSVRRGSLAYGGVIQLQLDEKAVNRAIARLDQFRDKPLDQRMQAATVAAAKLLEAPMKAAAPRRTGMLRRKVLARQGRRSRGANAGAFSAAARAYGADRTALVGSRAPHNHLIIRGHRIVTPSGRDTGRRTQPNPFVDHVARRHQANALRLMREAIVTKGLQDGALNRLVHGKGATR